MLGLWVIWFWIPAFELHVFGWYVKLGFLGSRVMHSEFLVLSHGDSVGM